MLIYTKVISRLHNLMGHGFGMVVYVNDRTSHGNKLHKGSW